MTLYDDGNCDRKVNSMHEGNRWKGWTDAEVIENDSGNEEAPKSLSTAHNIVDHIPL